MCRLAAYFGEESILLDEILEKPKNSLIKQSHAAKEGLHGINADGFGLAWYDFHIDNDPGIFKSIQPAWNDNNLTHIARKIKSSCFLAHVRASTVGDVNQNNCHPFTFKEYSLVHNGTIRNFDKYKRELVDKIDENLFLNIKGNTDSEHLFFLIMHFVQNNYSLEIAVQKSITWIVDLQKKADDFSRINIVITNGKEIIATRFTSGQESSLSLHYHIKHDTSQRISSLTLSSEPLDDNDSSWQMIPENSYLHLDKNHMKLRISKFK